MIDYETMIKALRLSWLKRITDEDSSGFWKCYLNYLLENEGGLFLSLQCNYDVNQINISSTFYHDLFWSNIREVEDPNNFYKYIIWNNKEIKVDGKSVFYRYYFNMNIKYTNDLLFDKLNIESFNVLRSQGLTKSNFLEWTGLRQSVPLNLRVTLPNFKVVLDLESFKCHDYYCLLIKQKLEKPSKWVMLKTEFSFDDKQVSEAFQLPLRVANEPYLRSFQYKVLNSILFTNDCLCKIGYISEPNCTFCHQLTETIPIFCLVVLFQILFGMRLIKILSQIKSCRGLSLTYCEVIVGFFEKEMDLFNYIVILGKSFSWTCRCRKILPSLSHFIRILVIKYETEKLVYFKLNKTNLFKEKWKIFEENILSNI